MKTPERASRRRAVIALIDDRLERIVDRYHDALAWLLDHRPVPIALCGAALALVAIAQGMAGSVALAPDTVTPERSPGVTQTDFLEDAYQTATGRSRLIRLEVRGPDRQTVSGVAHRIADDVRRVSGASAVGVIREEGSDVRSQTRTDIAVEHIARVEAVVVGRSRRNVLADIHRALESTPPPPGYRVSEGTQTPGDMDTVALSVLAIGTVGLVAVLLASRSQAVAESITIIVALLITITGVLSALLTTGHAISLVTIAGVLLVMGLATRDTVLLLNDAKRRHAHGVAERVALIEAARHRVRPVLAVAFGVAVGSLALALAAPEVVGADSSLGVAVVGGTVTAALATLFVTPPLRLALSDLARRRRARKIGARIG